jgi:hypothetical protein
MGRLRDAQTAITKLDDLIRRIEEHTHSEHTCSLWSRGFSITKKYVVFPGRNSVEKFYVHLWGHRMRVWYTGNYFSVTAAKDPDAPEQNGVFARMLFYVVAQAIRHESQLDFEGCLYEAVGKLEDSGAPRHPLFFEDATYVLEDSLPKPGDLLESILDLPPTPLSLLESLGLERHQCPVMFLRHHMQKICDNRFFKN